MDCEDIKVFVSINGKIYKRVLKRSDVKIENEQIVLPPNHYSRGYIERIIDGVNWDDYPVYSDNPNSPNPDE